MILSETLIEPARKSPQPPPGKQEAGPKSGFRDSFRGLEAVGHVGDADTVGDDVLGNAERSR